MRPIVALCLLAAAASPFAPWLLGQRAGPLVHFEKLAGADIFQPGGVPRFSEDFVPASETVLCGPARVAAAPDGTLYVTEGCNHRVRRIDPSGLIATVAGPGGSLSDGPAALAMLVRPFGLDLGVDGTLYVADARISAISTDGHLREAWAQPAWDVAVDAVGNLYAATGSAVLRLDRNGETKLLAGAIPNEETGQFDGQPLAGAFGIDAAPDGRVYVAESSWSLVHRIDVDGTLNTIAGQRGQPGSEGDGGPAVAGSLELPFDVAYAQDNSLYIAELGTPPGIDGRVRRIAPDGVLSTIAGGNTTIRSRLWGDGGAATSASSGGVSGLDVATDGTVYFVDRINARIRAVSPAGEVRTVAGSHGFSGDGGPAQHALVTEPMSLAFDGAGQVYFADRANHRIRRISVDGTIETIAGNGESGFSGDRGPAIDARLSWPQGVALDALGQVYIADTVNNRVRRVSAGGVIETIAGDGTYAFRGDGGPASQAWLAAPKAVTVDSDGELLIADTDNHRVRHIDRQGMISTIAGNGEVGFAGDGLPAIEAQLITPENIEIDPLDGGFYVADGPTHRVRKVFPDGVIRLVAGSGETEPGDTPRPAREVRLRAPSSVAVDRSGGLWIFGGAIHHLSAEGLIAQADLRLVNDDAPLPRGSAFGSIASDPNGRLHVTLTTKIYREATPASEPPLPSINFAGVLVAGKRSYGPVAPGAILSIFGRNLGPAEARSGRFENGALTSELAGAHVWIGSQPVPLLFVSERQINVVAPQDLGADSTVQVHTEFEARRSNRLTVPVLAASPSIITNADRFAAALNQDGSVHGADSPAAPGSSVSIFMTGTGPLESAVVDGAAASASLVRVALPIKALVGGLPAQVLYAGTAPGLVHGAVQVNLVIPIGLDTETSRTFPLEIRFGEAPSESGPKLAVR